MAPPRRLENLFRLLLPPACREYVLGDLHETYKTPRQYLMSATSVLAAVIVSTIRRRTDVQLLVTESLALYISFSAAAWFLGQREFLYAHAGFARLTIPTAVAVVALLICNAYSDPEKHSSMKPILQSAGSISVAFLGQAFIVDTWPGLAVPFPVMLYGSCVSVLLVSTLRMLFPPIHGRFGGSGG